MVVRCSNGAAFVVIAAAPTVRSGIRVDIYDGANPATLLDTLPDTFARQWTDPLQGTGSGSFSVFELNPKLVEDDTLLAPGNIARFILDGVARFALTIERRRYSQFKVGDDAARVLTVEGRGVLAKLEDAVVYPVGGLTGDPERVFTATNAGATAETLLEEAQARGALAGITWDFTATTDTNNAPWSRTVELTERAGTDVLRVVERLGEIAADVWMTPALVLKIANTRGVNRALQTDDTGPVVLRPGYNVVELERGQDLAIRNALLIETPAGFVERTEGASVTAYRRREATLSLGNVTATGQIDRHAEAVFRRSASPADELTVEVLDVEGARPYVNWDVGDFVRAPNRRGNLTSYRVRAITVTETPDGRPRFVPELATRTQELEEKLAAWLQSMARGTVGGTASAIAEPVKATAEVVGAIDSGISDHLADTLHVDELADLADVNLSGLATGDLLRYVAPNWVPRSPAQVAAAFDLDDVGDVQAPTPADGQVLTWFNSGGYWRPETPGGPGGGAPYLYVAGAVPSAPDAFDEEFDTDPFGGWTWLNQSTTTASVDTDRGVAVLSDNRNVDNISMIGKAPPSGSWTVEALVYPWIADTGSSRHLGGLAVRYGSTVNAAGLWVLNDVRTLTWASNGTGVAVAQSAALFAATQLTAPHFLRAVWDNGAGTLTWQASMSGAAGTFYTIHSFTPGATPDLVGFAGVFGRAHFIAYAFEYLRRIA